MAQSRVPAGVPNLPGYSVTQPMAAGYSKKQTLQFKNGYAVPVPLDQPTAAAAAPLQQESTENGSLPAASAPAPGEVVATFAPKYVQYDKQVLRYFGWFGEPVPDSPLEAWRSRKVCLLVYLEDDTMQVTEPAEPNSGLQQGTLVRRHKLPKEGGGVLTFGDLAVGSSVRVYGREVHIVDADSFTREFCAGRGVHLAPAQAYPAQPIEQAIAAKSKPSGLSRADPDSPSKYAEALLGREHNNKSLQQFLQHGGEVLRFWMVWDDRAAAYGDRRLLKMHFFVADSTAEIMEIQEPNSGRTGFTTFLKRGPLPKAAPAADAGAALPGQARLTPDLCYAPTDLRIGATVAILGRQFLIYDCDAATRQWYTERLGFSPEQLAPIDISEPEPQRPVHAPPPHTGVGSPEDSLQNCLRLVPKPPKKDQFRWQSLDKVVLRYEAVLEPSAVQGGAGRLIAIDRERKFVVSFFLADQTLAVFEPPRPNSGITGGKFLERGKVYKQGSKLAWYTEEDVHVGAILDLHGRRFRLTMADAFTEQYHSREGAHAQ
ncbi:hypothetical protein ABPG77_004761 [Micractinium sp. CCAP 211/92]